MRRFRVRFRPRAETDLFELYDYIAAKDGAVVAGNYAGRIETACRSLEHAPLRGTARDDIKRGLRTMGFEGRATIVFQVLKSDVTIIRILYGGRDIGRAFHDADDE